MVDLVDGEVGEEDGVAVGGEEEGGEGTFGVDGDGGFLAGEEDGEGHGDVGGGEGGMRWEERMV